MLITNHGICEKGFEETLFVLPITCSGYYGYRVL